ncbi:MAG: hypothetical protein AABY02_02640 [Nanoarchaeota archaeon]
MGMPKYHVTIVIPTMYCAYCRERIVQKLSKIVSLKRMRTDMAHCTLRLTINKKVSKQALYTLLKHDGQCVKSICIRAYKKRAL